MSKIKCPSQKVLSHFLQGKLDDARNQLVVEHIDGCTTCQSAVETISDVNDTLVSGLRLNAQSGEFEQESECGNVVELVKAIGRKPTSATQDDIVAHADQQSDIRQIGPYQFLEKLGEGGMGAVYKALHTKLDRIVAIKLLPADRTQNAQAIARFEREMKAVGKLDHPNIVRASDADEENGMHYLVMEHVDGMDLSQVVKRHGPLPVAAACELIRQAAIGLQHEHGLVHRDIKPSNIMVESQGSRVESQNSSALDPSPSTLSSRSSTWVWRCLTSRIRLRAKN